MKSTVSAAAVYCERARNGTTADARIRSPPIVGVPCLTTCAGRPLRADLLAEVPRGAALDELRPDHDGGDHRDQAGDQDTDHARAKFVDRGGDAFEPDRARGLHEDRVARADSRRARRRRRPRSASGRPDHAARTRGRARPRRSPRSPSSARERADLAVVRAERRAELGHLAEDRDAPAVAGPLGEVVERGAHRVGVRVVGVVDHEARRPGAAAPRRASGESAIAATPSCGAVERKPERVVGDAARRACSRRWCRCVNGSSSSTRLRRRARSASRRRLAFDVVRIEAPDRRCRRARDTARAPAQRAGTTAVPAWRERRDRLGVRLARRARPCRRARGARARSCVTTTTSGRAIAQSAAICPRPRIPISVTSTAVVGLEPADGERQADLVVVARLGPDRRRVRRAERAEDVLRRRLARRADDRDDACVALRADERRRARRARPPDRRGRASPRRARERRRRSRRPC